MLSAGGGIIMLCAIPGVMGRTADMLPSGPPLMWCPAWWLLFASLSSEESDNDRLSSSSSSDAEFSSSSACQMHYDEFAKCLFIVITVLFK